MKPTLRRRITPVSELSDAAIAEAHAWYSRFVELSPAEFAHSVRAKSHLVTWRDAGGAIRGTLVLAITRALHPRSKREVILLGTHHAATDPSVRGTTLLPKLGLRLYLGLRARHPLTEIYWLFDTFSYKSYLAMTRTFPTGWPRPGQPLPADERALVDTVMTAQHGDVWQRDRGVLAWPSRRLRPGVADISPGQLAHPDIAYFVEANRGHARGDCLVCLCPLTLGNALGATLERFVVRPLGRPTSAARGTTAVTS